MNVLVYDIDVDMCYMVLNEFESFDESVIWVNYDVYDVFCYFIFFNFKNYLIF